MWHHESRAYERIDHQLSEPMRSCFPKYYGTLELAYTACPQAWRIAYPEHGKVGAVVLELLSESRPLPTLPESCQSSLLLRATQLYSDLGDPEYVHTFIHLSELVETLHSIGIVHGDIRADNISRSMLFDFSRSWVFARDLPSIDHGRIRTMKERQDGELLGIYDIVTWYFLLFSIFATLKLTSIREFRKKIEPSLQTKFPSSTECGRCKKIMECVRSSSMEAGDFQS